MPSKVLNTPGVNNTPYEIEQFDHPEYGGAACLRMILDSDKVNAVGIPAQAAMFTEASGRNDAAEAPFGFWDIDPDGMEKTLDIRDPRGPMYVTYTYAAGQQLQANEKIIFTVDHYEVAPAVLIANGGQWLCVTGYETDAGGALLRFMVHDPSFNGSGMAFSVVEEAIWNSTYFTVVNGGVRWDNQFVAVCDPDAEVFALKPHRRPIKRPGDRIIRPDEATELALEGLRESEMERFEQFRLALSEGRPGRATLVRALDQKETLYYVVPLARAGAPRGEAIGAALVDARFGDLWMMVADPNGFPLIRIQPGDIPRLLSRERIPQYEPLERQRERLTATIFAWLDASQAGAIGRQRFPEMQQTLTRELVRSREPIGELLVTPELVEVSRTLVWRATSVSATPLVPFYEVSVGGQRLYVRAWDGLIFPDIFAPWLLRLGS